MARINRAKKCQKTQYNGIQYNTNTNTIQYSTKYNGKRYDNYYEYCGDRRIFNYIYIY